MRKKYLIIILLIGLILFFAPTMVNAADKYTATSTINGVTVNWEYELNESNEIENLKCINPSELTGDVKIPNVLDGKTIVSLGNNAFKAATSITTVTIPGTVKEIGMWAFSGCTNLSNIDLGSIEKINHLSFNNCTALTSIRLPKTLSRDASGAPFVGCNNLKNIELEDGMTVIPNYICASTPITEITIPNTVKEIGLWAFSGCTNLSNIDLGSIEKINHLSFNNCTALTSIRLPKTLSRDASGAPFVGCNNLKNIELEDGMTVIPNYICASTPITEITIPNTVKEIGLWAFKDCEFLKKITILDNVTNIEGYNSSTAELVFQNHNDDLTIYCYEDSMAANYAIKYNIKYVYLSKNASETPEIEDKKTDSKSDSSTSSTETKDSKETATTVTPKVDSEETSAKEDKTTASSVLPKTGAGLGLIISIIAVLGIGTFAFVKFRNYRDI